MALLGENMGVSIYDPASLLFLRYVTNMVNLENNFQSERSQIQKCT